MKKNLTQLMMDIDMFLDPQRPVAVEGWCSLEKAQHLAALVVALRPSVSVEIGVFGGRSIIPIAMAHAFNEHGHVVGIDPWSTAASTDGMDGENLEWWSKIDHEAIYQGFLRHGNRQIALGWLKVIRDTSAGAISPFAKTAAPDSIDLLHIDGSHSDEASTHDVRFYGRRVNLGGILVMDDMDWASKAAAMIPSLGYHKLYDLGTGAVFQRVSITPCSP